MKMSSIVWSFGGLGLPLLVALLAIPPLLHTLGPERFGLLSLAWTLTAMSGLFDLGLGRATTRLVADQLGRGDLQAPLYWQYRPCLV
jgi:O-antigen/teichoic acid export membrane protein